MHALRRKLQLHFGKTIDVQACPRFDETARPADVANPPPEEQLVMEDQHLGRTVRCESRMLPSIGSAGWGFVRHSDFSGWAAWVAVRQWLFPDLSARVAPS
jgi:hypothetical protein